MWLASMQHRTTSACSDPFLKVNVQARPLPLAAHAPVCSARITADVSSWSSSFGSAIVAPGGTITRPPRRVCS